MMFVLELILYLLFGMESCYVTQADCDLAATLLS